MRLNFLISVVLMHESVRRIFEYSLRLLLSTSPKYFAYIFG